MNWGHTFGQIYLTSVLRIPQFTFRCSVLVRVFSSRISGVAGTGGFPDVFACSLISCSFWSSFMASEGWDLRSSSGGRGGRLSALSWYPRRAMNEQTDEGRVRVKHIGRFIRSDGEGWIGCFGRERDINVRVDGAAARWRISSGHVRGKGTHWGRTRQRPLRSTKSTRFILAPPPFLSRCLRSKSLLVEASSLHPSLNRDGERRAMRAADPSDPGPDWNWVERDPSPADFCPPDLERRLADRERSTEQLGLRCHRHGSCADAVSSWMRIGRGGCPDRRGNTRDFNVSCAPTGIGRRVNTAISKAIRH